MTGQEVLFFDRRCKRVHSKIEREIIWQKAEAPLLAYLTSLPRDGFIIDGLIEWFQFAPSHGKVHLGAVFVTFCKKVSLSVSACSKQTAVTFENFRFQLEIISLSVSACNEVNKLLPF